MTNPLDPLDGVVNIFSGDEVKKLAKNSEDKKAKFFGRKIVVNVKNGKLERIGYGTYLLERLKSFFDTITNKPADKIKKSRQDFCNRELAGYRLLLEAGKGVNRLVYDGIPVSGEEADQYKKKLESTILLAYELAGEIDDQRLKSCLNDLANSLESLYQNGDLAANLEIINSLADGYQTIISKNAKEKYIPLIGKVQLLDWNFRTENGVKPADIESKRIFKNKDVKQNVYTRPEIEDENILQNQRRLLRKPQTETKLPAENKNEKELQEHIKKLRKVEKKEKLPSENKAEQMYRDQKAALHQVPEPVEKSVLPEIYDMALANKAAQLRKVGVPIEKSAHIRDEDFINKFMISYIQNLKVTAVDQTLKNQLSEILSDLPVEFINKNAPLWIEKYIDRISVNPNFAVQDVSNFINLIETHRAGSTMPVNLEFRNPEIVNKYLKKVCGGNLDVDKNPQLRGGVLEHELPRYKINLALKLANIKLKESDDVSTSKGIVKVILKNIPDEVEASKLVRTLGLEQAFLELKNEQVNNLITQIDLDDRELDIQQQLTEMLRQVPVEFINANAPGWISNFIDHVNLNDPNAADKISGFIRMVENLRAGTQNPVNLSFENTEILRKYLDKFVGGNLDARNNELVNRENVKVALRLANIQVDPSDHLNSTEEIVNFIRTKIGRDDKALGFLDLVGLKGAYYKTVPLKKTIIQERLFGNINPDAIDKLVLSGIEKIDHADLYPSFGEELAMILTEVPVKFINEKAPIWIEKFIEHASKPSDIYSLENISNFIQALEKVNSGVNLQFKDQQRVFNIFLKDFVGGNLDVDNNQKLLQGIYDSESSRNKVKIALKLANIEVPPDAKFRTSEDVVKVIRDHYKDDATAVPFLKSVGLEKAYLQAVNKEMNTWLDGLDFKENGLALYACRELVLKMLEFVDKDFIEERSPVWITRVIDKLAANEQRLGKMSQFSTSNLNKFLEALDETYQKRSLKLNIPGSILQIGRYTAVEENGKVTEYLQPLVARYLEGLTQNGSLLHHPERNPINPEHVRVALRLLNITLQPGEELRNPERIKEKIRDKYPAEAAELFKVLGLEKPTQQTTA